MLVHLTQPDADHHIVCHLAAGLATMTVEKTAAVFQVTDSNPMVSLEGCTALLTNLSKALKGNPQLFRDEGRPGNIVGTLFPSFLTIAFLVV
jgi:hypothetical protein